jgi:hypothetical protein
MEYQRRREDPEDTRDLPKFFADSFEDGAILFYPNGWRATLTFNIFLPLLIHMLGNVRQSYVLYFVAPKSGLGPQITGHLQNHL